MPKHEMIIIKAVLVAIVEKTRAVAIVVTAAIVVVWQTGPAMRGTRSGATVVGLPATPIVTILVTRPTTRAGS